MLSAMLFLLPVFVALSQAFVLPMRMQWTTHLSLSSSTTDDFASFAASLEPDGSTIAKSSFESTSTAMKDPMTRNKSWQEDLDELLDPQTPVARKQLLLSDLAGANSDIQASIQSALRDGKVCQQFFVSGLKKSDCLMRSLLSFMNEIVSISKRSFLFH